MKIPGAGAPIGNDFAVKFETPEKRKKLLNQYVAHCESGYSDEAFVPCSWKTLQAYVKKFPDEFPLDIMEKAQNSRRLFWEDIGVRGTLGHIKGFSDRAWNLNMMARYGWSKKSEDKVTVDGDAFSIIAERRAKRDKK